MNAIQFIKEQGIEKARKVIEGAPEWAMSINFNNGMYYSRMEHKKGDTFLYDIKRFVESVDLINRWGGIQTCKYLIKQATSHTRPHEKSFAFELKQAIADYESIYGGEHV